MQRLMDKLDQADAWVRHNPMVWPGMLLSLAVMMWCSALVIDPRPDQWVYLFDMQLGETCAMVQLTGQPCPSCGMTRSFAWAARMGFVTSFLYNPAGLALFWSITAGGLVGAVRLATKDPNRLTIPYNRLVVLVLIWTIGLYILPWFARMGGINPLP